MGSFERLGFRQVIKNLDGKVFFDTAAKSRKRVSNPKPSKTAFLAENAFKVDSGCTTPFVFLDRKGKEMFRVTRVGRQWRVKIDGATYTKCNKFGDWWNGLKMVDKS